MQTKEEVAMIVVNYYASLYKAENRRAFKENQKSAQQRVTDFLQLEKTELFQEMIKSTTSSFKIQLSLDDQ
jgi:hypothetical protein